MDDRELSARLTNIENDLKDIKEMLLEEIQEQTQEEEEPEKPKIKPKKKVEQDY